MDDERITEQQIFEARWYLNGFPKSGTHLLVQMVKPIANLQPADESEKGIRTPWAGTFKGNSWTEEWVNLERITFKAARLASGHILKAHAGYMEELARFLWLYGMAHVFIYRDLRDVAVSQAYHVINSTEDDHLAHPEPEAYDLDDFNSVLRDVIVGKGRYAGVIDRWRHYAPWLDVDWVLSVRFEDLRTEPKKWAERIFRYGTERTAGVWGRRIAFEPSGLEAVTTVMAYAAEQRERSPTFRKGAIGDWRQEFTDEHRRLFKLADKDGWLVRLGYEKGEDW